MKKSLTILFLIIAGNQVFSQNSKNDIYWKSASEFIFSFADVSANTGGVSPAEIDVSPVVRFSGFFHFQEQLHINFSKNVGMYTGFGVRNIGMINKLNDSIRVKQRSYSIGVPLAFKFGNINNDMYVAIGGEAELMFHYKQKVIYDDQKKKNSDWFSDKVNLINPSAYIEFVSKRGSYIRFKYYILDFLVDDKQDIRLYNGTQIEFVPEKSQLFYVSIGASIKHKKHRAKPEADKELMSIFNH